MQRLGATQVAQPDGLSALMKECFPDGVDYAFDAVGDPETTKTAFRWTRNAGLTVIVGLPALGATLELDPTEFIRREKALTGTIYGSEDPAVALPILLEHVRSGALDLVAARPQLLARRRERRRRSGAGRRPGPRPRPTLTPKQYLSSVRLLVTPVTGPVPR